MDSAKRKTPIPKKGKESSFRSFLTGLRKKRIIEILAAFIGGGWLILEFVHWILIDHYHFPEESLDITFITLACALICTLLWRIFGGVKKKVRKIKVEFILIPLVMLITAFFDIRLIQQIGRPEAEIISETKWKNSIAVLPFANISPEEGQEYFCDGLTEELINRLSNIRELKVPARTSAFAFKGEKIDIRDVGQKLNVDKVLEGSVRKTGNRIRITAQLINVADGYHLWSEKYDRKLEDVFAIQDEISLAIVNKLRVKLLGEERANLVKRYTENLEAYNLYLKGRWLWDKNREDYLNKAIDCYEQALEIDPNYAKAYVGIADVYLNLPYLSSIPTKEAYRRAKEAVLKALELDNMLAGAYNSLAGINETIDYDWVGAERDYKRAIELNPGYATAHSWYAYNLSCRGKHDEALAEIKLALELDPFSYEINLIAGTILYWSKKYDQAIKQYQTSLELYPNSAEAHYHLGLVYVQMGEYEEAISRIQKAIALEEGSPYIKARLGYVYAVSEHKEKAVEILDKLKESLKQKYVSSALIATIYVALGERDHAFQWLEKAYEEHDVNLGNLKVDPIFDSLRSDSRFKALLKKMNFE